jgi:anti-sigma regulatory factor (Ser/Thr protein kinase)
VDVVLERTGDALEVSVTDQGRWHDGSSTDRGRGLALMRALMDDVVVDASGDSGTTLILRRTLRAPAAAAVRR